MRLLLRSIHGLMPAAADRSFYERAKRSIEGADEAVVAVQQLSRPPPAAHAASDARHAAMFGSVEMSTKNTLRILRMLPLFSLRAIKCKSAQGPGTDRMITA
jgi:hypothetical protein